MLVAAGFAAGLTAGVAVFIAAGAAGLAPGAAVAFGLNDLMYATRAFNCSSVTCPLNVGMIG